MHPRTALLDIKTRKWRVLMEDAADARYLAAGYVVFLRQGTLMAVPFDVGKLEIMGQPVPLIANVMQSLNVMSIPYNTASGQFSISDSGWLVYAEGGIFPDMQNSLVWVDRQGKTEAIAPFKAPFFAPRLSPDGKQIAYTSFTSESQIWVYDINRGTARRLTDEGKASFQAWTPDGKRLVFGLVKEIVPNLYWQPADGSGAMERLTTSDHSQRPESLSPDGATLAFEERLPGKSFQIVLLDMKNRRTTPFLNSSAIQLQPEFSPDGHWLAYVSNETGRSEVYVSSFPSPGSKWVISREGGIEPLWARSGKQLYYRSLDGKEVWTSEVQTGANFSASKPRLVLKLPDGMGTGFPGRSWDMSLDGQRFLMVKLEEEKVAPVTELVLIVNWVEDLKRLIPTAKK